MKIPTGRIRMFDLWTSFSCKSLRRKCMYGEHECFQPPVRNSLIRPGLPRFRLSPAAWDGEGAQAVFSSFAIQFSFLATKGKQSVVRCETQSNSYSPMKFNKSSQKYLAAIGWYLTRFQHFTTCPGMSYIVLKNPVAGLDSLEGPPN